MFVFESRLGLTPHVLSEWMVERLVFNLVWDDIGWSVSVSGSRLSFWACDVRCYIVYYYYITHTHILLLYIIYYSYYNTYVYLYYIILYLSSSFPISHPLPSILVSSSIPFSSPIIHSIRVGSSRSIFIFLGSSSSFTGILTPHVLSEWMVEVCGL